MGEIFGIDVSHHNGCIDWPKVARSGRKFAILKCQYESKAHHIDETFEYNYKKAGEQGIARGIYIFVASDSIANPQADVKAVLDKLKGRPLEYGVWLDYESAALKKLSKPAITKLTYVYADALRDAGYFVGIYCNKYWYDNVLESAKLCKDFDFWIARYPLMDKGLYNKNSSMKPNDFAAAWQYSSKGKIPGINGYTDLNVDFDGNINLMAESFKHSVVNPKKKSVEEIAREVIAGKWGNNDSNPSRRHRLESAGYSYSEVQTKVNKLLSK